MSVDFISHRVISYYIVSPHFISNHLTSVHFISNLLVSSRIISSHFMSSHIISSHLISSHLISSHLISSHLISSHLISSHLISSHLISSHLYLSIYLSIYLGECPSTVSRLQKVILYVKLPIDVKLPSHFVGSAKASNSDCHKRQNSASSKGIQRKVKDASGSLLTGMLCVPPACVDQSKNVCIYY